jgi:hypothetical protein
MDDESLAGPTPFQMWEHDGGCSLGPMDSFATEAAKESMGPDARMVKEFVAASWAEARRIFADHYGWRTAPGGPTNE